MTLFQFRWLRKFIRKNTNHMEYPFAHLWKRRLSVAYAIIAWNAFGLVCYMIYTGRNDWVKYYGVKNDDDSHLSPGQQWAKTLKIEKSKIIKFSGFERVSELEINNLIKDYDNDDINKVNDEV